MHKSGRCDNRDKLDDNAIPISEVNEERTERERERERRWIKERLLIKRGRAEGDEDEELRSKEKQRIYVNARAVDTIDLAVISRAAIHSPPPVPSYLCSAADFSDR